MGEMRKPPIGLLPQDLADERARSARRNDIREAIDRYLHANWPVPIEWLKEWNELIEMDWKD
jgi:hypothetical protein